MKEITEVKKPKQVRLNPEQRGLLIDIKTLQLTLQEKNKDKQDTIDKLESMNINEKDDLSFVKTIRKNGNADVKSFNSSKKELDERIIELFLGTVAKDIDNYCELSAELVETAKTKIDEHEAMLEAVKLHLIVNEISRVCEVYSLYHDRNFANLISPKCYNISTPWKTCEDNIMSELTKIYDSLIVLGITQEEFSKFDYQPLKYSAHLEDLRKAEELKKIAEEQSKISEQQSPGKVASVSVNVPVKTTTNEPSKYAYVTLNEKLDKKRTKRLTYRDDLYKSIESLQVIVDNLEINEEELNHMLEFIKDNLK